MRKEATKSQAVGRIQSLDALRGIASLAVVWFHMTQGGALLADASEPWIRFARIVGQHGFHGVTLFFVLSGFVIPLSIERAGTSPGLRSAIRGLPTFLLPRLIRLHPPFVAATPLAMGLNLISIAMPGYRGWLNLTASDAILSVASDSLLLTGILGGSWILVVAWTLAFEVQFYVVAGIAEPATSKLRRQRPIAWVLLALLAISALVFLFPQSYLIFSALPVFSLGVLTSHRRHQPLWLYISAVSYLLALLAFRGGQQQAIAAALSVTLILIAVKYPLAVPNSLLWLGGISYSLFLIHVPIGGRIVNLASRWEPTGTAQALICMFAASVSIIASWIFCLAIEKPCHNFGRAVAKRISSINSRAAK